MWRDTSEDPDAENGVTEEEQCQAQDALRDLVRRGLVESAGGGVDPLAVRLNLRTKRPERFWMRALVAAFALETLECTEGENGEREAQQRRLEHYRRAVEAVSASSHGSEETQLFGVFVMSLDLPNIRAAHDWARSHSSDDRRAQEYLSQLLSQSPHTLSVHLAPEEFLEWMRMVEEAAQRISDDEAGAEHRANLGAALLKNGLIEEALPYCEECIEEARRSGDAAAEAAGLANLSAIYSQRGDDQAALVHARMAEDAARRGGDTDLQAVAFGRQARVLTSLGRPAEAERRLEDKRDFAKEKGRLYRYAEALRDLLAHIKRDRPEERDEARQMYEEAASVFWDHRQYDDYRRTLNGLGILEAEAGVYDAAEVAFECVLRSALDDGDEGEQARAKMHLGIVHWHEGSDEGVETAETEFREALPLAASLKDAEQIGNILLNLAYLLLQDKGDELGARKTAEAAADAYANAQSDKEAQARELIAAIESANG
jgi:tetratricopeptide (TPR) repeat protein